MRLNAGDLDAGHRVVANQIVAVIDAGNPARYPDASYLYSHASELYDVTGGSNVTQTNCGGDYQCNAVPGYDGPTGNGTPDGIAAF